jgi:hypothetical protein
MDDSNDEDNDDRKCYRDEVSKIIHRTLDDEHGLFIT